MMISAIDAIHMRRSIRAYRTEQLTDGQLQAILDAGLAAPSAVNRQPFHFSAVQDQALLTRINEATRQQILQAAPDEAAKKNLSDPSWSVFYHAPTVIFLSCPPLSQMRYAQTDSGIAIENMALAAVGLGLGSVILGRPREAFAGPEADEFRKALCFPEGYDFILALAVGYPAEERGAHAVRPGLISIIK